jgi:hypothetical protein
MAFNPAPSGWFPGLTASSTALTIPYSSLNNLTQANADPSTGDVRAIIYSICEAFSDKWSTTDSEDRPSQTTIVTSQSISSSQGEDFVTKNYTIRVSLDIDSVSVSDE